MALRESAGPFAFLRTQTTRMEPARRLRLDVAIAMGRHCDRLFLEG